MPVTTVMGALWYDRNFNGSSTAGVQKPTYWWWARANAQMKALL